MSDAKRLTQAELGAEVTKVIDGLMQDERMFTAFDVTKALRSSGFWAEHGDVRDAVHGMFERGEMSGTGYVRTLVPVPGKIPAFVYHVYTDDAHAYSFGGSHDAAPSVAPTTTTPATATPKVPTIKVDGGCTRDKFRRVNVLKALVNAIGLRPGDVARVYLVGDQFEIVPASTDVRQTTGVASYVVNCKGNVRFSGRVLDLLDKTCDVFVATLDPTRSHICLLKA